MIVWIRVGHEQNIFTLQYGTSFTLYVAIPQCCDRHLNVAAVFLRKYETAEIAATIVATFFHLRVLLFKIFFNHFLA